MSDIVPTEKTTTTEGGHIVVPDAESLSRMVQVGEAAVAQSFTGAAAACALGRGTSGHRGQVGER